MEDCTFLTYTVRLKNKGFFPAEWISLELTEAAQNDVLILPDDSRHMLAAGSMGDIQVTVLNRTNQPDTARDASRDLLCFRAENRVRCPCGVKRRIAAKCGDVIREDSIKNHAKYGQF